MDEMLKDRLVYEIFTNTYIFGESSSSFYSLVEEI